jgi:hypothetical protein
MTRHWGSVAGAVFDERGAALKEALVVAFSDDRARWFSQATTTQVMPVTPDGKYRLGLRPGRYLVVAVRPSPGVPLFESLDNDVFERLAKHAIPVTVGGNDLVTIDLRVAPDDDRP